MQRERKGCREEGHQITGSRVFEGCGGGIKATSGNPDWLKGAMRDYERIYLRFSAAATVGDGATIAAAGAAAAAAAAAITRLGSVYK